MDVVQGLEAKRSDAARAYRAMVDDEALDWTLPETVEKEGKLKAEITAIDARIKAKKDAERLAAESAFKG